MFELFIKNGYKVIYKLVAPVFMAEFALSWYNIIIQLSDSLLLIILIFALNNFYTHRINVLFVKGPLYTLCFFITVVQITSLHEE